MPRRKFWKKAVTRRAAVESPVGKYEQNPVSEQTKCSVSKQVASPDNVQAQSPSTSKHRLNSPNRQILVSNL